MQYRPEVDGLRALAVIPVVLFHAQLPGFSGGFVGVDIFFVISGYLITSIIYGELARGSFDIGSFYERRIRRLFPALFVVLAASTAMALAWLSPSAAQDFFKSLIAVPLFGSNLYFAETTGYFSTAADLKPLLHTWSLSVEEQYYFVFPVLMLLAWRLVPEKISLLIAGGLLLSLLFSILYLKADPGRAFYSTPARCWELMMGALVACRLAKQTAVTAVGWKDHIASMAGLIVIVAIVIIGPRKLNSQLFALLPTISAILIIHFARPGTLAYRILSNKVPVFIGLLSYSIYLWHQPLMAMARIHSAGLDDEGLMYVMVAVTMVLAYLTWRYVETPFRNRDRYPARRLVSAAGVCSVTLIGVGLAGAYSDYATFRFGPKKAALSHKMWDGLKPRITCAQNYHEVKAEECIFGNLESSKTLGVIGDSHASQWTDALDDFGKQNNIRIVMFAKSACASANVSYHYPALRREYWECAEWRNNVIEKTANFGFDAVLITTSSAGYAGAEPLVTHDEWKKGVTEVVESIQPHTNKVFWLIDNPRYLTNPLLCVEANFWQDRSRTCSAPRNEVINEALIGLEYEALKKIPKVQIIDFHDAFCNKQRCAASDESGPLMRDTNHLSVHATNLLQPKLASILQTMF